MQNLILHEDDLINGLFEFIRLNTELPKFFAQIRQHPEQHEDQLQKLIKAINKGNASAKIFNHPNCYLYLLYLIKEKKIAFWQGMTTYVLLMAYMQFTDRQSLKASDNHLKSIRRVEVQNLVEKGMLTPFGKSYIEHVIDEFKKLEIKIDYDTLVSEIIKLPVSEHWLLNIKGDWHNDGDIDTLFRLVVHNVPFFWSDPIDSLSSGEELCTIPTTSIINLFLHQISLSPVQLKPIFGTIGDEKLRYLHSINQHPGQLYAPHVKSNLTKTDNFCGGPFMAWLHDIAHTFWGSILSYEQRKFLYEHIIPKFESMRDQAKRVGDEETESAFRWMIEYLHEYNLTNLYSFSEPTTRLQQLTLKALSRSNARSGVFVAASGNIPLGQILEDAIFYLLCIEVNTAKSHQEEQYFWQDLLQQVIEKANRKKDYVCALQCLADLDPAQAVHTYPFFKSVSSLDLDWWYHLLSTESNSEKIWLKATGSHSQDLIVLISQYGLKFFEPYLPLNPNEHKRLQEIISRQLQTTQDVIPHIPEPHRSLRVG